jgi:hypothetical protein
MMTDRELSSLIDQAERDSITQSGDFNDLNEKLFKYYNSEPFGDEQEGRSQVVTSDCADIVESDMPSHIRIFLSGNDVAEFKPTNGQDVREADDKNIYIPYLIRNVKDSFRKLHGWIKQAEIQKLGILEYGIRDERRTKVKHYEGLTELALIQLIQEFQGDSDISKVEIIGQDVVNDDEGPTYTVDIRLTEGSQEYFFDNVANEDFICSRNAEAKEDADIVGKRFRKSRGDLVAMGFDEDLVRNLPGATVDSNSSAKQERYKTQGGETTESTIQHWTNELVEGMDVYAKIDFDEDGIPERRHVIKVGVEILENEPFDHVPYAIMSAMLMPMNIVGKSRVEQGLTTQRVQSVLNRNILDNIYSVNNPGHVVNDQIIEIDDLLTQRPNRIVRSSGQIAGNILPIETPYIGDRALQVVQYMDSLQARRTGSQLAAQGLDQDSIHKETATRFQGVQDAAAAKTELVARVMAETGFRDLYEGLAWFAMHFQDQEREIFVLGRPMVIDPSTWKFDHKVEAVVGTGAGDNEKTLETLSGVYALQLQQKESGSTLTDDAKIYNTLEKIIKASGLNRVEKYFNDPQRPDQTLAAENHLLKQQLTLLSQQLENPLEGAEKIKQQGSIARDQMKYAHEEKMKAVDVNQDEKDRQAKILLDTAKLELENNTDLPGGLI